MWKEWKGDKDRLMRRDGGRKVREEQVMGRDGCVDGWMDGRGRGEMEEGRSEIMEGIQGRGRNGGKG